MVGESNLLARSACQGPGHRRFHLWQLSVYEQLHRLGQKSSDPGSGPSGAAVRAFYPAALPDRPAVFRGNGQGDSFQFHGAVFKKYVNDCDMLLVEDIHTLTGKNKTQEELNTILDYLIKSGRRVILTSAVAPNKIVGIDDDFRSRMTSGSGDRDRIARLCRPGRGLSAINCSCTA
jgi:chromosomal replication initiator protein